MTSTKRSYFDDMYAGESDPWGFATSGYEHRKYAVTVASLPKPRYASAFEPGCSIGVLTELLAPRCDALVATEVIPATLAQAKNRLTGHPHVTFQCGAIPEVWPPGPFDLIVLSEIAYYFDETDLGLVISRVVESSADGAHVVGVHWRGATDYPLTGDRTHDIIDATPQLSRLVDHVEPEFALRVWELRA